jgi:hypothetical protein
VFASFGVQWGRAFIRRLIELASPLPLQTSEVDLDSFVLMDIDWWIHFAALPMCNGISYLIDPSPVDVEFFSDSSLPECAGVWPIYNIWWFHVFTKKELSILPDISCRELFAIVANCATFGKKLKGKNIMLWSDNSASVDAINSRRAFNPVMNSLIRELFYICAIHSFQIQAKHLPGVKNGLADCLSRSAIRHKAWSMQPSLNQVPLTPILPSLTW